MVTRLSEVLLTRQARQLWLVFLVYVVAIFSFGTAYWALYRSNPSSFLFNADVLRTQSAQFSVRAEELLRTHRAKADVLKTLLVALENGAQPVDMREPLSLSSTLEVVVSTPEFRYSYAFEGLIEVVGIQFRVLDAAKNEVESVRVPDSLTGRLPTTSEEWRSVTTGLLSVVQAQIHETERQLTSLSGPAPEVWSFWDFLYFSSITQSTVGYGDIVPNRTAIRVLVMLQLLVTAVLLIVVLNIVVLRNRTGGAVQDRRHDPRAT